MSSANDSSRSRPARSESADSLSRIAEPDLRTVIRQRGIAPRISVAPFRVGSIPYLNTVPLTCGIEDEVLFATSSRLAEMLGQEEIDAALVSVTEVLLTDRYDVLEGVAIASLGEVKSLLLAHRRSLAEVTEVFYDTASLTIVNLLKVLFAELDIRSEFRPLPSYESALMPDAVLLIGDPALDFLLGPHEHNIWDLGTAWFELTGLPFVYAVWALRRGTHNARLRHQLREAKRFGMDTLDSIIRTHRKYDYEFRKDYLGWHIHYHLGSDEKRGLEKFIELLRKHSLGAVYEPRFVD